VRRPEEGRGGAARLAARRVPPVAVFRCGPVRASVELSGADLVEGGGQKRGTVLSEGRKGNGRFSCFALVWLNQLHFRRLSGV